MNNKPISKASPELPPKPVWPEGRSPVLAQVAVEFTRHTIDGRQVQRAEDELSDEEAEAFFYV